MGRNLQPKHRASRRFGENVADTVKSPLEKRSYPVGVHGPKKAFAKTSAGLLPLNISSNCPICC